MGVSVAGAPGGAFARGFRERGGGLQPLRGWGLSVNVGYGVGS